MEGYDLMALFGLNTAQQANGEDEVDDNDDDFYNDHSAPNGDAQAGVCIVTDLHVSRLTRTIH